MMHDGRHPNVLCPPEAEYAEFQSIEDINNYLLSHKEVIDFIRRRGGEPKFVFLIFDEETERLAEELGGTVWFPKAKLRTSMDNKIETVRVGNKPGYRRCRTRSPRFATTPICSRSVTRRGSAMTWCCSRRSATRATRRSFIRSEDDFRRHEHEIVGEGEIKIMKRIDCRGSAIEACATKEGTIVGPLMTEPVGFRELTPYRGGWCGNEIFDGAFSQEIRDRARDLTFKFGEQLREEGYCG